MGVKHLWDIIDETKTKETLDYLRGKVVSVDLSIWIVEAIKTLQFKTSIIKPHLRNIFYRILALRKLGIKLLFVTEGDAPDLKQETMKKRNEARYGVKSKTKGRVGRSRFQNTIKECCQLLDLLGMPYIRAAGEAEAMCAVLNLEGYSDGCLTNDGDFLLYGGQTIFRDFGIDPKDPHVFVYNTDVINNRLNINRNDMIGLALIAGCDYTNGIAGVGKGLITKFLEERCFSEDLLSRFKKWQDQEFLKSHDIMKSEIMIARKAMKSADFFNQQIIDEYLISKDVLANINEKLKWRYPNIRGLQEFLDDKMEWPFDYTLSKIMQLSSSTYLEKTNDNTFYPVVISPVCIVKTRCQYGVALVEIKWEKDESQVYNVDMRWENCPETFTTIENHQAVLKSLPGLVESFSQMKLSKKSTKSKKKETKSKNCNIETVEIANDCFKTKSKDKAEKLMQDESYISSTKESLESPGLLACRPSQMSGDFLSDVLCEEMKEMSLQEDEKPPYNYSDSDKENVLPLFDRLNRKLNEEGNDRNIEKNECTPKKNGFVGASLFDENDSFLKRKDCLVETDFGMADLGTSLQVSDIIQPENQHARNSLGLTFSNQKKTVNKNLNNFVRKSPVSSLKKGEHRTFSTCESYSTPLGEKNLCNVTKKLLVERTPCCLQFDTPILANNSSKLITSNHSLRLASSTPYQGIKEPYVNQSPQVKDISTFSDLGDSILGHSMDLFDGSGKQEKHSKAVPFYKEKSCHKSEAKSALYDSLDLCEPFEPSILISKMSCLGDSILCESLDLANTSNTCNSADKLPKDVGNIDNSIVEVCDNYEDLLREKFHISQTCNDVSMRSIPNHSNTPSRLMEDNSMIEGSPLCLADRLKSRMR